MSTWLLFDKAVMGESDSKLRLVDNAVADQQMMFRLVSRASGRNGSGNVHL